MSFLLEKAECNKAAFHHLKQLKLFAAAIHCGYYYCIQKIIHILKEYYTEEYNRGLQSLKGGHGNRHRFYIEEFSSILTNNRKEQREVRSLLFQLRTLRIAADYEDSEVSDVNIEAVGDGINKIQRLIRKNLHL